MCAGGDGVHGRGRAVPHRRRAHVSARCDQRDAGDSGHVEPAVSVITVDSIADVIVKNEA